MGRNRVSNSSREVEHGRNRSKQDVRKASIKSSETGENETESGNYVVPRRRTGVNPPEADGKERQQVIKGKKIRVSLKPVKSRHLQSMGKREAGRSEERRIDGVKAPTRTPLGGGKP